MNLNFEILGRGDIVIIVETALGSTFIEWKPILQPLSNKYQIFLYDRAGYGKSDVSNDIRSPKIIASQLSELLNKYIPDKKYLLIGHSIGGLYIQQYIRDYQDNVIGAIFLDPVTTEDDQLKSILTSDEYKRSGIDKSQMIKMGLLLGRLRLLRLFKPLFEKAIPFYYYKDYDLYSKKQILNHLTQLKTYETESKEYDAYLDQKNTISQLIVNTFPQIPVRVLYHNPEIMIKEINKYGGLTESLALKIDMKWQQIIDNHYSNLSGNYQFITTENSGHFIHLTDQEILYRTIEEILSDFYNQVLKNNHKK